ncbi:hypothetical protein [Curtobacterium sp. MCBA15_008]|uniref:hypothetical protein n=1 Tax=Curtobacterium sp. MCBA15_008 TaxID=1898736 RepID=UPI0008DD18DC|nr:hypothetical protein [Curtobacterium sp. MCBA15_008]OII04305.1 hypothetical protein BIU96_07855 [Curtobacterium sp. MCBA15_008]
MPEQSWQSVYFSHLCSASLVILNLHAVRHPMVRNADGTVPFKRRWSTMGEDALVESLWVYTKAFASAHIDRSGERLPKLYRKITVEQMDRDIRNAARLSIANWDGDEAERIRDSAARGGRRSRRQADVTTDMVAPFLEALEGYSRADAARLLAGLPWTTPTGRSKEAASEKTMVRRLTELGFTGSQERRKKAKVSWHVLDGLDGLTVAQQAEELGLSTSYVNRLRKERKAALEVPAEVQQPVAVELDMDAPGQVETLVFDLYKHIEQVQREKEAEAVAELTDWLDEVLP